MFQSTRPFVHPDTGNAEDETFEREAQAHLAASPHLQVVAELLARLRASTFSWWSPTFTRARWRALARMQWLSERPDVRQRITSALTGLPPRAARSKTCEFQAGLIDAVLDHGEVTGVELEAAFRPQEMVIYGPAIDMWSQFRQRMPWGDDAPAHRALAGWLMRVFLSERSTLDPEMLRKPVLSAWELRSAIEPCVWQDRVPIEVRAAIDDARLKREKARPREPYCARHELQIATPELLAEHIPLSDLLPVVELAEQSLFGAAARDTEARESDAFQVVPIARPAAVSTVTPRPLAVAR